MPELIFWIAALIVAVVGTMIGFGSSTLLMPVAVLFFDFPVALLLVAVFHFSGNIGRVTLFRKGLDRMILVRFGVPAVALTLLGAYLVAVIAQPVLRFLLGCFLVVYALIVLFRPSFRIAANGMNCALGGSLSGFLAGLIGTGGAVRSAFLTAFDLHKHVYLSTSFAIALIVDITRIPVYALSGFLPAQYYWYVPFLAVIAIIGAFAGKKLVDRVPRGRFRKVVLVALLLMGVKFVAEGLTYFS